MKIRHSLAAVLLAAAAAPVALGAAPAFADTVPAGQGQTDPAETKADEENRAAIERLLVYPNDYLLTAPSDYLREHAGQALAGTPADRARFLAVEADRIRRDDARIAILWTMNAAGPAVKKAANTAFGSNDLDVFRAYLNVGQYTARAEDENRAKVQQLLDDPNSGPGVREGAQQALAGTAADVERFLNTGLKTAAEHDDRVLLSQIMSHGGPAVKKAANAAMSGTIEDVRAFLKTGQYVARAEDENRAKVQDILADAGTGRHVREAAEKALAGSAADVEHFLKEQLEPLRAGDDRIHVSQLIAAGGPEVRKAGLAALDGDIADVRAFLKEGQFTARAKDQAAAKTTAETTAETATETSRGGSGTTQAVTAVTPDAAVAPVSATTGTTTTGTTTAATTTTDGRSTAGGSLAATGTTAPLGQLGAAAGAAVVLGAGAVVASRRRSQA
ncbi:ALF repeat-containing protein [Kitasatospora sp. NPDC059811]|uniref:ALF repeat-containing protein n=1 Tax=Streptomycetaceae TaxID=2062 RepID=UPI0007AFDE47|nr:ALF repeat-containing protein [Streptomyces sp. MJM8645]